jgi:hypothetical protein
MMAKSIEQHINGAMAKKVVGRTTEIHKSVLAVSYDEASRTGLFYRKSGTGKTTGAISWAYAAPSASAMYAAQLMAGGNGVNPVSSGAPLWRTGLFTLAITEAQLDALFERHKSKLGL